MLESRSAEKDFGILYGGKLNTSQQCTFTGMRDNPTWGAPGVLNADQGMWFFLSTQRWQGHIWTVWSSSHPPSTRKTQNTSGSFSKRLWSSIMGLKHFSHEERLKELRLASWEKISFSGDIINAYKYRMEEREDGDRLLLTVPSVRPRYNRHKSKYIQFHLNSSEHKKTHFDCDNGQT